MISVSVKKGHLKEKKLFILISSPYEVFNDDFIVSNAFYFRFLFSQPEQEIEKEDIEFKTIPECEIGEYNLLNGKFISFNKNIHSKDGVDKSQALMIKFSKELVHYDVLEFIRNVIFEIRCENKFPELRPLHAGFYSGKKFFGESDSTGLDSDGFINVL